MFYSVDCSFAGNAAFIATKKSFDFVKSQVSTDVYFAEPLDSCQVLAFEVSPPIFPYQLEF